MADKPKIQLMLADVDGALVTHQKVLTERALAAVKALHEKKIKFAITSGRPPRGMAMLIEPLKIETPVAGFNGGAIVKPDMTPLVSRTLDDDAVKATLAAIEKAGIDAWVYTAEEWMIRDPKAPHVEREQWTVKFPPKVVKDFDGVSKVTKIVGISDDSATIKKAQDGVQETLGKKVSAALSQPYYLDVTHPLANKSAVVDYLCGHFGIARSAVATMGDMPNDTLMFHNVGLSIAMGNASDDVKKQAAVVTDSCDDDGFAKAMEKYLLAD